MKKIPANLQVDFVCETSDIIIYQITIGRYLIGFIKKKKKTEDSEEYFQHSPFYTPTYRPITHKSMTDATVEMIANMKKINDALTKRLNMVEYK